MSTHIANTDAVIQPGRWRPVLQADTSHLVLPNLPLYIAVLDTERRMTFYNPSSLDSMRKQASDVVGLRLEDAPWWEDRPDMAATMRHQADLALSGRSCEFEGPYVRLDGTEGRLRFRLKPIPGLNGEVESVLATAEDITEWAANRDEKDQLLDELNHRVKNMLTLVGSIVNMNLRKATDLEDAQTRIHDRLQAYARSQDLIYQTGLGETTVAELISSALSPFPINRTDTSVQNFTLPAPMAVTLTLVLHELATNASKYGAWSRREGRVRIAAVSHTPIRRDERGLIPMTLTWTESGGPTVTAPMHSGVGTTLTQTVVGRQFKGEAHADYRPEGLVWTLKGFVPV